MATQEKLPSTGTDLDVLIHSLEFENQQYVKMIEKENQRNLYLESQEQEKLGEIAELKTQISNLEADTKNCHRQLVHNKNTLESLKKSRCVLQAHKDALCKRLDLLQFENNEQQREFEDTVQMYEKTWTDYETQYKSLALYKTLREKEDRLSESQAEQSRWQLDRNELQGKIQAAKDELDFRDWQRFCIKMYPCVKWSTAGKWSTDTLSGTNAEKKAGVERRKEELLAAVGEKEHLQAKLKDIREKNTPIVATPLASDEVSQDLETEVDGMETSDRDHGEEHSAEKDQTLAREDGGESALSETQKGRLCTEQPASSSVEDVSPVSLNTESVAVPNAHSSVSEDSMEEDGTPQTDGFRHPERFEPRSKDTVSVAGTGSVATALVQETVVPKLPHRLPPVSIPYIKKDSRYRVGAGSQDCAPRHCTLPQKVILPPKSLQSIAVPQTVVVSQRSSKPPQVSVPYINLPKPVSRSATSRIPTVQSALSSILSGARSVPQKTTRPPAPVVPKIAIPRIPLLSSSPSPVLLSRLPCPPAADRPSVVRPSQSDPVFLPLSSAADRPSTVTEMAQCSVAKPVMSASSTPVSIPASGSHIPRPVRPTSIPPSLPPPVHFTTPRILPVAPDITTSAAGDAPPLLNLTVPDADMSDSGRGTADGGDSGLPMATQDEDMESDSDSAAASQPMSSPKTPQGCVPETKNRSFSPFDLDKHQRKLQEINRESEDSFSFQQRHFFSTRDNMVTEDNAVCSTTTSTGSVFNMTFVSQSADCPEQAPRSLFRDNTAPGVSSPPDSASPTAPSREERSGSFFSFESMDTSENQEGVSLLSMFGRSSKETDPEPTFSFNFGGSPPDSGNGSGFSFSFGGGGRGREETPGSVFSLF